MFKLWLLQLSYNLLSRIHDLKKSKTMIYYENKHTLGGRYIEVQWLSKYGSILMSTS